MRLANNCITAKRIAAVLEGNIGIMLLGAVRETSARAQGGMLRAKEVSSDVKFDQADVPFASITRKRKNAIAALERRSRDRPGALGIVRRRNRVD